MDFIDIIKKVAPFLGTALGGPLGGLAVEAATQALGVPEKTAEGLRKALAGPDPLTGDQLLALKKAESDFQVQVMANAAAMAGLDVEDRKSARNMEVALKSNVPRNLTYFLTVGMTALLGLLIYKGIPDSPVVQLLLGSYTTAWTASIVYWFGSTHGSERKTDIIANSTPIQ